MPDANQCPDCGAVIPDGQPMGLCPRCALSGVRKLGAPASGRLEPFSVAGETPALPGPARRDFGDYELLEEIARGGMGVVFKARQKSLDRIVAVKLLLSGPHADADFIKRFRIEASAAAALQHPNIVAIHEVGVHEGEHFIAMEFVDGPNLAKLVREQPLPPKSAAAYLKTIAEAIHYAHERGILHRDLKPSNVLLDAHDQPRVTDFGLAKRVGTESQPATDLSQITLSGQVMGSPGYMPPEQASGRRGAMSRRSDVYSLGAMLYHLLTGRPPFGGGSIAETLRQVETQEPVSVKLLNPSVPLDLETICLKCLEKEPGRRYATAKELAEELGRFANDESIRARPIGRPEKFWRWCRRRPALASLITAVLLGSVAATWQAVRATRAEEALRKRVVEVAAERDGKEKARQAAEAARQEAEAISSFLREVFRSPNPARDGRTITVAETLARAAEKLEIDLTNQPSRRASLQTTLARTYFALGLPREAIPLQEKARDYYEATLRPEHPDTLTAMSHLALFCFAADRRDEALKLREETLRLRLRVSGPEHKVTLKAMNDLATSYAASGRLDEAFKLWDQLLPLYRKVLSPEHPDTLGALNDLATSYSFAGRRDEALRLWAELLPLHRKVLTPEHPYTLDVMNNLANSYARHAGRPNEALQLREETLRLRLKVNGPEHTDTLKAMINLAISYADAGRQDEALKLREEVLTLRRKVLGPGHSDTLKAMHDLAVSYSVKGRPDEVLKLREETLKFSRKANDPKNPDTLSMIYNLAKSYDVARRYAEAELHYRELIQSLTTPDPSTNDNLARVTCDLAELFANWAWSERGSGDKAKVVERAGESERLLRDALALRVRNLQPGSTRLADTRARLGGALVVSAILDSTLTAETRQTQFSEAETLLLQSYESIQQSKTGLAAESAQKRDTLARLVRLYEAWDKPEKITEWQQEIAALDAAEAANKKSTGGDAQEAKQAASPSLP